MRKWVLFFQENISQMNMPFIRESEDFPRAAALAVLLSWILQESGAAEEDWLCNQALLLSCLPAMKAEENNSSENNSL